MKLDSVTSNTRLTVNEVEERDARDRGTGAKPHVAARPRHLTTTQRRRPRCTGRRRGRLGDHLAATIAKHEMKVAVALEPDERHCLDDAEDVAFERQTSVRQ